MVQDSQGKQTNKINSKELKEFLGVAYFTTHTDAMFKFLSNLSFKNLFNPSSEEERTNNKQNMILLIVFIILLVLVIYFYKDMIFPLSNIPKPNPNSPF